MKNFTVQYYRLENPLTHYLSPRKKFESDDNKLRSLQYNFARRLINQE